MRKLRHRKINNLPNIPQLVKSGARFKFWQCGFRSHNLNHPTMLCSRLHAPTINIHNFFFCSRVWTNDYSIIVWCPPSHTHTIRLQVPQGRTVCYLFIPFAYQVVMDIQYTFLEGMHVQLPAKGLWESDCGEVMGKFLAQARASLRMKR